MMPTTTPAENDGPLALRTFSDPPAFLAVAGSFLLAHEAEHALILGICQTVVEQPERFDSPPYLAVVARERAIVAAAIQTPPWNLVLSRLDDPAALPLLACDLAHRRRALAGVAGARGVSRAFAEEWRALTGQGAALEMEQRLYALERVIPVAGVPGALRRATLADRDLLIAWTTAFIAEVFAHAGPRDPVATVDARLRSPSGALYLWEDGEPVCYLGAGGPTPHGMRIGPVYTPPAFRRRGYASAATAALSQLLLDGGRRFCVLYTDLANPTSNRIYQAIGYRPLADEAVYRFVAS